MCGGIEILWEFNPGIYQRSLLGKVGMIGLLLLTELLIHVGFACLNKSFVMDNPIYNLGR